MHGLIDEIRSALRGLLQAPLFTFVAVASLALGIGANSAIFSLIDQVILKTLPVERPGELVQLFQTGSHYGSNSGPRMHSYPRYRDFRDQSPVHAGLLCRREISLSVTFEGTSERTGGEIISGNYFDVLGVKPHLGRLITPDDDKTLGGHPVAVLGYDYWKTRFSADPSILGKDLLVNNIKLTIIGVSAPDYFGLDPTRAISLRMPVAMHREMMPSWGPGLMENRRNRWVQIFARLKPGFSPDQAKAQLQTQFSTMRQTEVTAEAFATAAPEAKSAFLKGRLDLEPAANGYSGMRRQVAQPLWILMGIVGLVLLIACTNVANLLIARSMSRRREFAVRAALGASRWRLMRPLLVESTLLSLLGGGTGLILAFSLNSLLISFLPPGSSPLRLAAAPDWRILAFTFAVAFITDIVFGLFPAISADRADAAPALKEEGRGMSTGSSGLIRKTLVGVQVALSILLLIAAGLFVKTLQNLKLTNTGLQATRLITFQAEPSLSGYSVEQIKQMMREFRQRAEALPGVTRASVATIAKMSGFEWDSNVTVEGFKHDYSRMPGPYFDAVTPGYVESMGMKILEGRDFLDSDMNSDTPAAAAPTWRACLINKKFADTYFKGRNPIGYHLGMGGDPGTQTNIEIVGVFSDAKYMDLREEVQLQVLVPLYQTGYPASMVAYVRTSSDEQAVFSQLRGLMRQLDPNLPIYAMRSFEDQIDLALSTERLMSFLASAFGIVATVLAAIGLYGVLSLAVSRRLREIGIRIALGAESYAVTMLVLREILFLIAGGVVGLALAYAIDALLLSFLPTGNSPLMLDPKPDFRIFAFTFLIASTTGLLFGLFPALTASRADTAPALKAEGRGIAGGSGILRKALVGVQVSLSILLLIAAGLFVRSLENLRNVDTGLKPSRLITFSIDPSLNGYSLERITNFQREFVARMKALPGVESVGLSSVPKMQGFEWDSTVTVEGYQAKQSENIGPFMDAVSPGYVQTMGMRILEGRDFRDNDTKNVALINKKFADKYFNGRPLGKHFGFGGDPGTKTEIEIVGVFSDARYENVRDAVPIQALIPLYTAPVPFSFVVYARATADESSLFAQSRALVRQLDPTLSIYEMRSFSDQMDQILSTERLVSFLASAFGLIATILASIGLYGVLSLAVARRLKEIGIRLALGAESTSILRLVLGEIAFLILGGIAVGIPSAILLSRYIESQLCGLKPTDPATILTAVSGIVLIALLAAWLPARRATRVNPLDVLRYD